MHWNPIFSGLTQSSVWRQPDHVRLAWIAILANKDFRTHKVRTNALILADQARISRENAEDALRVLCSPDRDSLDPEFEGRRLEKLPAGGYLVLNGEKYSRLMSALKKKEYDLEYRRGERAGKKPETAVSTSPEQEPLPPELDSPAFRKAWADFKTMRARKRKPVTPVAAERLLKQCLGWGSVKAIRALDNSIANDWQGLFDPDKDRDGNAVKLEDDPRFVPGTTIPYFDNGKPADPDPFKDVREAILGPGAPLSAPSP